MRLFDVPLHFNLHRASKAGNEFDLRTVFDGTLVKENPLMAVTFVDNHDSQPGQSLESWVDDWFKQHAYALTMLRRDGYPCVFYGRLLRQRGPGPSADAAPQDHRRHAAGAGQVHVTATSTTISTIRTASAGPGPAMLRTPRAWRC
jgi:glycosidase